MAHAPKVMVERLRSVLPSCLYFMVLFFVVTKLGSLKGGEKEQSVRRQNLSPERSSIVFAERATIQAILPYSRGSEKCYCLLLERRMPTVDEIYLYHIIFYRYPDLPVALLSFFPQVRQRWFVQDIDVDLVGDRHQYFSAGPFVEGLFEIAAWHRPASVRRHYGRRLLPVQLSFWAFYR
jgi:hypothetical protein